MYEESTAGGAEWMTCLQETCELLWPSPAIVTLEGRRPGSRSRESSQDQLRGIALPITSEFLLVPGVRRPPLLVPAGRRGAAAAVRLYNGPSSPLARLGARALTLGLASGLGEAMLRGRIRVRAPARADTIETYLKNVVSADIRVSMYLGPARANRKPILQVLTTGGEPVGFAKIGINRLTRSLVRAERDSLTQLNRSGLSEITVPRVLHYDQWHDLDVLVLSALPAWLHRRPLPEARLTSAITELSYVGGHQRGSLVGSEYLRQLRSRLAAAGEGAEQAALLHAIDTITEREGGTVLGYGAWHGDWAPWNMANTGCGLLVWDWERFTCGVPLGFDALHYRLQAEAGSGRHDARSAAARCPAQAARLLAPFGIGAREARTTAILYLADLAVRYLADRQAQAGARRGAPGTWLIPAITDETARL